MSSSDRMRKTHVTTSLDSSLSGGVKKRTSAERSGPRSDSTRQASRSAAKGGAQGRPSEAGSLNRQNPRGSGFADVNVVLAPPSSWAPSLNDIQLLTGKVSNIAVNSPVYARAPPPPIGIKARTGQSLPDSALHVSARSSQRPEARHAPLDPNKSGDGGSRNVFSYGAGRQSPRTRQRQQTTAGLFPGVQLDLQDPGPQRTGLFAPVSGTLFNELSLGSEASAFLTSSHLSASASSTDRPQSRRGTSQEAGRACAPTQSSTGIQRQRDINARGLGPPLKLEPLGDNYLQPRLTAFQYPGMTQTSPRPSSLVILRRLELSEARAFLKEAKRQFLQLDGPTSYGQDYQRMLVAGNEIIQRKTSDVQEAERNLFYAMHPEYDQTDPAVRTILPDDLICVPEWKRPSKRE